MLSPDQTHDVYGCRAPAAVSDFTPVDIGPESTPQARTPSICEARGSLRRSGSTSSSATTWAAETLMIGDVDTEHRAAHWQNVYRTKSTDSVSWYRPHLDLSLEILTGAGLCAESRLIDVGAGASTLVDDLIARGVRDITVLDVSADALAVAQRRLGKQGRTPRWHAADLLTAQLPRAGFDFWHDRAVLHFLSDLADTSRYAQIASDSIAAGGYALISGFAPDGPERCSGLPVTRRSPQDIAALLGPAFELEKSRAERHRTPGGAEQSFAYALLRRR